MGAKGRVYALEIQKNLLQSVSELARKEHLSNVDTILCDLEAPQGTKIKEGALDVGILVNTLFQIEQKDVAFNELGRVIRKGGKLFIIDWTNSFSGLGPAPDQIFTEDEAKALAERHGFSFERSFPTGEHHYGIALRKV